MRVRISSLFVTSLFAVATLSVALPMSFEFRQLVSLLGVSIVELLLLPTLLLIFVYRPRAFFPIGYRRICMLLYLFLVWSISRGTVGVMEGNELDSALRGVRHYLPFLTLPPLLYLLHTWSPDARRNLATLTTFLIIGYFVYALFLALVVISPTASNLLLIKPFLYRISSSTIAISMTLLLLAYLQYKEKNLHGVLIALAITSVGITFLLAQSRMSSVMLLFLVGMSVFLYTVRTLRMRFLAISASMLSTVLIALLGTFLLLNYVISDFEQFTELFTRRVQVQQQSGNLWESAWRQSFGTEAFRARVISAASTMPEVGFGEGKGVGQTMSQEDGAYIDSTMITMWFKNGFIGVILFYAFWIAIGTRFFQGYLEGRSRLHIGVASIGTASIFVWMLWSSANIFLMYGWVLYPIMSIIAVSLFLLEEGESSLKPER